MDVSSLLSKITVCILAFLWFGGIVYHCLTANKPDKCPKCRERVIPDKIKSGYVSEYKCPRCGHITKQSGLDY